VFDSTSIRQAPNFTSNHQPPSTTLHTHNLQMRFPPTLTNTNNTDCQASNTTTLTIATESITVTGTNQTKTFCGDGEGSVTAEFTDVEVKVLLTGGAEIESVGSPNCTYASGPDAQGIYKFNCTVSNWGENKVTFTAKAKQTGVCVCVCVRACVRARVRVCVRVRVRVRVRVCLSVSVWGGIQGPQMILSAMVCTSTVPTLTHTSSTHWPQELMIPVWMWQMFSSPQSTSQSPLQPRTRSRPCVKTALFHQIQSSLTTWR